MESPSLYDSAVILENVIFQESITLCDKGEKCLFSAALTAPEKAEAAGWAGPASLSLEEFVPAEGGLEPQESVQREGGPGTKPES